MRQRDWLSVDQAMYRRGGVDRVAYQRVLARVAILESGVERLGVLVGVSGSLVARWIQGEAPVPHDVFLRCVHVLLDHEIPRDPGRPVAATESIVDRT